MRELSSTPAYGEELPWAVLTIKEAAHHLLALPQCIYRLELTSLLNIFEIFLSCQHAVSTVSGLGLYIVKNAVAKLGWAIDFL